MKTMAAVAYEVGKPFAIEELDLDPTPREGELRVRYQYSGMCHSDLHSIHGHLSWMRFPMVAGHEGAGIVEEVGPGVTRVQVGDHVVCSFIPSCGTCHWCATGQQPMCDWGADGMTGNLPGGRFPLTGPRGDYGAFSFLGTFSQYGVVHQNSVIKIDPDLPLERACLVSCGVPTGWGSSVNAANVRPGDVVVIYGIGGIGSNAVQGARMAGAKYIVAVDPLANKCENARLMGATHTCSDSEEAQALVQELTLGVGAKSAIVCAGVVHEDLIQQAYEVISKGGTVVVTGVSPDNELSVHVNGLMLSFYKKTVKGTLFGDCNPTTDIPRLLGLYRTGDLKLDELVTKTYRLDQINEGYDDLVNGKIIRGVVAHEH